ncbi:hypothetical protein Tco_0258392, partial [Tanacetum coccineum]
MNLSPQAENIEAFETKKSASTPPTSPHHIILSFETKSRTVQYGYLFNTILHDHHLLRHALPSLLLHYLHRSPPPENVESLKDNIRA